MKITVDGELPFAKRRSAISKTSNAIFSLTPPARNIGKKINRGVRYESGYKPVVL